jgi:hypothetical protein
MKRKPTIKSLRAGQTIWYPHYVFAPARYEVRKVAVLSDKAPMPDPGLIADGFPRGYVRERMSVGGGPEFVSYSRRKVASWIKARGGVMW